MTLFPDNGGREGLKQFRVLFLNDTAGEPRSTVIPRLTKIIRSGITFVSRNLR